MDLYTPNKKLCAFRFTTKNNEPFIIAQFLKGNNIITSAYPEDELGEELLKMQAGREAKIPQAISSSLATVRESYDENSLTKFMHLGLLNTKEGYRKKGIGGEVFELTARECFEQGIKRMFWQASSTADKLYEEHGAKPYTQTIYTHNPADKSKRIILFVPSHMLDTSAPRTIASQPSEEFSALIHETLPEFNAFRNGRMF
ncbi:MAG: GNAT family N-acetyltransferase [Christensenellaceae bacterium]|jgi:GNAT superfamily N-acetyltransferase|nr:GNAT family N-acetyltransferase [Christensenellaceae bacterium]